MGKKHKNDYTPKSRDLLIKDEFQDYGKIIKAFGSGHMEILCNDGETRMGTIRGSMYKRVWINIGDFVLVSIREFEDNKIDIIHKYTLDEARKLIKYKEFSPILTGVHEDENDIIFEDENDNIDIDEI